MSISIEFFQSSLRRSCLDCKYHWARSCFSFNFSLSRVQNSDIFSAALMSGYLPKSDSYFKHNVNIRQLPNKPLHMLYMLWPPSCCSMQSTQHSANNPTPNSNAKYITHEVHGSFREQNYHLCPIATERDRELVLGLKCTRSVSKRQLLLMFLRCQDPQISKARMHVHLEDLWEQINVCLWRYIVWKYLKLLSCWLISE